MSVETLWGASNPISLLSPKEHQKLARQLGGRKAYDLYQKLQKDDLSPQQRFDLLTKLANHYQSIGYHDNATQVLREQFNLNGINHESQKIVQKNLEALAYASSSDSKDFFLSESKKFLEQALDPFTLMTFTASAWAYRFTELRILKSFSRQKAFHLFPSFALNRGPAAFYLSRLGAFTAENLAFSSLSISRSLYDGGPHHFQAISDQAFSNLITLSALKGFGHLGRRFHARYLTTGVEHLFSPKTTGHLSAVLGLSLAHDLQWQWGLRPDRMTWKSSLMHSIILQSQLSLGAYLVGRLSPSSVDAKNAFIDVLKSHSRFSLNLARSNLALSGHGNFTPREFNPQILMMSQDHDETSRSQVLTTGPYNIFQRASSHQGTLGELVRSYPDLLERTLIFDLRSLLENPEAVLSLFSQENLVGFSVAHTHTQGAELIIPASKNLKAIYVGDHLIPPEMYIGKENGLYRHARYRVEQLLGRGGNGVVVRLKDTKFDRNLAAKFVRRKTEENPEYPHQIPKAIKEEAYLSTLSHTVSIHGAFQLGPYDVILMEEINGMNLGTESIKNLLKNVDTGLSLRVAIAKQIMAQIEHLSRLGLIHRDIKPDNVMVAGLEHLDPDKIQVRIYDMGISQEVKYPQRAHYPLGDEPLKGSSVFVHPQYMGVQQAFDNWREIDLYGAGLVLYELLTGHHAYEYKGPLLEKYPSFIGRDQRRIVHTASKNQEESEFRSELFREVYERCKAQGGETIYELGNLVNFPPALRGIFYNWFRYQISDVPRAAEWIDLPLGVESIPYLEFERIIRRSMGLDGQKYHSAEKAYRDLDRLFDTISSMPERKKAHQKFQELQGKAVVFASVLGENEQRLVQMDPSNLDLPGLYASIESLETALDKYPDYRDHVSQAESNFETALAQKGQYDLHKGLAVETWQSDPDKSYRYWLTAHEAWSHYLSNLIAAELEFKLALNLFPESGHARSKLLEVAYLRYTDTYDDLLSGERRALEHVLRAYDPKEVFYNLIQSKSSVKFLINFGQPEQIDQISVELYRYQETGAGREKNYRLEKKPILDTTSTHFEIPLERGYYLIKISAAGHFPLVHRFKHDFGDLETYTHTGQTKKLEYDLAAFDLFPPWLRDRAKDYYEYIPPLQVEMGIDPKRDLGPINLRDLRSHVAFKTETEAAFVGRYPVTVLEYAQFINSLVLSGEVEEAKARLPRYDDGSTQWALRQDGMTEKLLKGSPEQVHIPVQDKYQDSVYLDAGVHGISYNDVLAYLSWRTEEDACVPIMCIDSATANGVSGGDLGWAHSSGHSADPDMTLLSREYFKAKYGTGRKNHPLPYSQIPDDVGDRGPYGLRFLLDYLRELVAPDQGTKTGGRLPSTAQLIGGPVRSSRGMSNSRTYGNPVLSNQTAEQAGSFRLRILRKDLENIK